MLKKIIFPVLLITFLASCKKDYTCTCTITQANGSTTEKTKTLIDMRNSDAKKVCIDYEETKNGITTKAKCELK